MGVHAVNLDRKQGAHDVADDTGKQPQAILVDSRRAAVGELGDLLFGGGIDDLDQITVSGR
jgi:hypothetical protein